MRRRYLGYAAFIALLLLLGGISLNRALRSRFDFHHFYIDAEYVWQHGALNPIVGHSASDAERQLPFYLPTVSVMIAPLAAGGRSFAACVWTTVQLVAFVYSVGVLLGWCRRLYRGPDPRVPLAITLAIAVPALIEAARFNQVSYFVLALVLGGVTTLERGRPLRSGTLLAAAAVLKLLPGILLIWLLLKRRWRAAGAFCVAAAVFIVLPPLLYFGPQRTWTYHRDWVTYNMQAARGMLNPDLPEHFIDRRNESFAQVLARLTWPEHPYRLKKQPLHLSAATCANIARGLQLAVLAALVLATRRSWRALPESRRKIEAAAYMIAMLALAPLVRQYYLVWVLPALTLFTIWAADASTVKSLRRIGRIGLAIWILGMAAWPFPITRVVGTHLVMLLALGGLLLAAHPTSDHAQPKPA